MSLKTLGQEQGKTLDIFDRFEFDRNLKKYKEKVKELDETYFKEGVERMKDAENPYGPYSLDKEGNIKAEKTNRGQASLFDIGE